MTVESSYAARRAFHTRPRSLPSAEQIIVSLFRFQLQYLLHLSDALAVQMTITSEPFGNDPKVPVLRCIDKYRPHSKCSPVPTYKQSASSRRSCQAEEASDGKIRPQRGDRTKLGSVFFLGCLSYAEARSPYNAFSNALSGRRRIPTLKLVAHLSPHRDSFNDQARSPI